MQIAAAEFIAIIIALATGCVVAVGLAWRWHRKLRDCQSLLDKALKDLELTSAELAALNVAANRMKTAQSDGFNEPINYPPSRYVA